MVPELATLLASGSKYGGQYKVGGQFDRNIKILLCDGSLLTTNNSYWSAVTSPSSVSATSWMISTTLLGKMSMPRLFFSIRKSQILSSTGF